MRRRVVITGMGAVTPLGVGLEQSWKNLIEGKSGIGPITRFDPSPLKCQVAGEVKDFHPEDFMDKKLARRLDRFIHFALAAARMAVEDAGLKINPSLSDRFGIVMGSAIGAASSFEEGHRIVMEGRYHEVPPFLTINLAGNTAAGVIAIQFGARGPHHFVQEACATGTNAIGLAFRIIRSGEADVVITGGSDAGVCLTLFAGLEVLGALTCGWNKEPIKASRPFDKKRDGFVSSEGAGMLVLESLDFALRRDAKIYAEVLGYGSNCDAYHFTAPSPDGEGAARCMQLALEDAGITPEEVDYINAHGTSTVLNDLAETKAIKKVFGEHAHKLAVSSNKSMLGHMWGGSGAVEAIFSAMSIKEGIIPPTINYEYPDPECDLDYVPNTARRGKIRIALSNSFGFGGINGSLVLGEYRE